MRALALLLLLSAWRTSAEEDGHDHHDHGHDHGHGEGLETKMIFPGHTNPVRLVWTNLEESHPHVFLVHVGDGAACGHEELEEAEEKLESIRESDPSEAEAGQNLTADGAYELETPSGDAKAVSFSLFLQPSVCTAFFAEHGVDELGFFFIDATTGLELSPSFVEEEEGGGHGHNHGACNVGIPSVAGYDFSLHIGGIFIVLIASALGVGAPFIISKFAGEDSWWVAYGKHFGTGVVLSTALVHMLLPAVSNMNAECLEGWGGDYEAYPYLFTLIAILAVHAFERFLNYRAKALMGDSSTPEDALEKSEEAVGHAHPVALSNKQATFEVVIQAYLLEVGFSFHSVFIGITLGVNIGASFTSLLVALTFHQCFEGVGLGSRLVDPLCDLKWYNLFALAAIFALSAPLGMAIGVGIVSSYDPSQPSFLLATGIIEAMSAGILLYIGFLILLGDFARDLDRAKAREHIFGLYLALYGGAGLMSFIGKYI